MRDRPINLNLFTIKFPITAIASILHRISGIILFLLIPVFLSMLQTLIFFPEFFAEFHINKLFLFIVFSILIYHLLAGVRHLIMDYGYAESKHAARISSYVLFVLTIIVSLLMGYCLC